MRSIALIRVWLASPYYLPSDALNEALLLACRRGVDVVILTPARSHQWLTDLARGPYLREVQARGGKVLLHPGMLHAKMGTIDDTAWVGSANFDMRSIFLNSEMALLMSDADSVLRLTPWFDQEAARSQPMAGAPNRGRQFLEGFLRLLAPVL
jgi:cardiolipin synthase